MTLARRNYNQEWLPSLFNDLFDTEWMPQAHTTAPAINVSEENNAYKIEVATPGMTKDDFKIYISEDNLIIAIEKKNESNDDNKKYLRREFSYSKFEQALILPENVDRDNISASVNDGILTIDLKKKPIEQCTGKPKMIEIK